MTKETRSRLLAGIALFALVIAISIPAYKSRMVKANEQVLRSNLLALRLAIDQYTEDKKVAPRSLQNLVDAGYFQKLPVDPVTHSNSMWKTVSSRQSGSGITDVHSGSSLLSSDGTAYDRW
jgi:general secretion pathway protein G